MKRLIQTGLFRNATLENKRPFIDLFGSEEDAAFFHPLYFQWYNIIHEVGHIVRWHNGMMADYSVAGAYEERAANDFAVAYWKRFGDRAVLKVLLDKVESILAKLDSPVPPGVEWFDHFIRHFWDSQKAVRTYAYFQFSLVREAFYSSERLEEVLRRFGFKVLKECETKTLRYREGSSPQHIVDDCRRILDEMGIPSPDIDVTVVDNPMIQAAPGF